MSGIQIAAFSESVGSRSVRAAVAMHAKALRLLLICAVGVLVSGVELFLDDDSHSPDEVPSAPMFFVVGVSVRAVDTGKFIRDCCRVGHLKIERRLMSLSLRSFN